jgi:hypothetical protein
MSGMMNQLPTEPVKFNKRMFFTRLARNLCLGLSLVMMSLLAGMCGYRYFEGMSWIDAYVNAAMILSGMGPVATLNSDGGKIFAGTYALFSGIFFLVFIAIIVAPVFHHFFHKLLLHDSKK